ncbi:MAG: ribonuclease P protein component [Gammaproteobacteria bacterium]|nr:ribonuclease P protein component [Gammaproteobacteria bacterium]|tara:strand:- start:9717 stop:10151 length:435 start_codon:yes stop_codon:yes gene_type:complete
MAFVQECLPKREGLFCQTEEKKAERFSAHSLSTQRQKIKSLNCIYSSKYFRLFYKDSTNKLGDGVVKTRLEISISKKFYKLAVERNKIKRKIKEIFRTEFLSDQIDGVLVFSVFKPFGELSYKDASDKIKSAIKSVAGNIKNEH